MTLVALVVAFASVSTAGGVAPPITTETRAAIRVQLDAPAPTSREALDEATRLTSSALAWAGVRVEWVVCANDLRERACPMMDGPADVTIRVDRDVADVADIVRGWPRRMCQVHDGVSTLPIDALITEARARELLAATVIAHALLHQIGHRFLGAEHSSEGILAARYPSPEMRAHAHQPRLSVRDVVLLGASIVSRLEGSGTFEHERLVSVDPRGNVVRIVDGQASQAVIHQAFDAELRVPGANLTVVHNHPSGTSFSGDDLVLLNRPGVARVRVIGHDGSVYEASRGPRFERRRFAPQILPRAHAAMLAYVPPRTRPLAEQLAYPTLLSHMIATALHEARVIVYRATLGRERSRSEFMHHVPFRAAAMAVANTVRQDLDRAAKADRVARAQP